MDLTFLLYVLVGFAAQIIDGSLGMAYGVSCNTFLLSLGIPPAAGSASVHAAEVVTTGISGAAHWKLGNVDKKLFLKLLIPGMIGGGIGAYLLTAIDGSVIKPYISIYLLIMGIVILVKAFRHNGEEKVVHSFVEPLAAVGGFFDAVGGGGWGPVVTTTLVARGNNVRKSIGSVNLAEFFVTLTESVVFILTISLTYWKVIVGLLIGGAVAAPFAAFITKRVKAKVLMIIVGTLIIALQLRTLIGYL